MTEITDPAELRDPTTMAEAIRLDDQHYIVYAEYQGEPAGINEWHLKPNGKWCNGWVPFEGSAWARQFDGVPDFRDWCVVQREPLTLTPSIKCRACGSHGHIVDGMWVPA
jgi:hypothetical protein